MKDNSLYMILPSVSAEDKAERNPKLWHVRNNRRCRWHDLPENWRVIKRCERKVKRNPVSVEALEPGEACKVRISRRWHRARIWYFCEQSARVWLVVYPYSNSSHNEPFPLLVDLDEAVVTLSALGVKEPEAMPKWASSLKTRRIRY